MGQVAQKGLGIKLVRHGLAEVRGGDLRRLDHNSPT